MKYLKKYNESIDSIEKWVDRTISTCQDIMLDAQDNGLSISVNKKIDDNSLVIECSMAHVSPYTWGRYGIIEIYNRLSDYMKSEGFEEIDRLLGNVGNFPVIEGRYTAKIVFKESLKGYDPEFLDYLAKLRYNKRYNLD